MSQLPRADKRPRIDPAERGLMWEALVPGMARMPIRATGFRLFWQQGQSAGYRDFPVGTGQHFIVGAHARADIVLSSDEAISQRHLLVLSARTPSGAPALRILDLRARVPMYLGDDRPLHSLRVHGGFALRLGHHVLGGFPITTGPGWEAPPSELPEVELEASDLEPAEAEAQDPAPRAVEASREVSRARPQSGGPYRRPITRIEALKRPSTLVEVASTPLTGPGAILLARRAGREVGVPIADDDLVRGVLIGRAERCLDAGLRHVMTMTTSRIHAILMSDADGATHLLDAASTNGSFVDGVQVRSALLGPGAQVRLGTDIDLELRRRF